MTHRKPECGQNPPSRYWQGWDETTGRMPDLQEILRESRAISFVRPRTYDAIVVGTGAAGGVACRELTRAGMNVLALEAGWEASSARSALRHPVVRLFAGISTNPAFRALPAGAISLGRKALKAAGKVRQPVQTKCFAWELSPGSLVDDRDCPYETPEDAPFHWFRARQLGGRMIVPGHGRQYYRFGPMDLGGRGDADSAWPIEPHELDPWYEDIEKTLGLRGGNDRSDLVPDSKLTIVNTILPSEAATLEALKRQLPDTAAILGRYAPPADWMSMAASAGQLMIRTGAVVRRVMRDGAGHACGVEWLDCRTGMIVSAQAPVVFLCASAFETTRILMLSRCHESAEPVGLHSAALGCFVMDHAVSSCTGYVPAGAREADESLEDGRCLYLPMRAEIRDETSGRIRQMTYGVQVHRHLFGSRRARVDLAGFAPMQPRAENRLTLTNRTDKYGMPVLKIECRYSAADKALAGEQMRTIRKMSEALGLDTEYISPDAATPGTGIHECGGARMGADPATSVVDANNECWDTKGLFVTDAAAFPSMGAQNPTLTIMAQSARAAAYAASRHMRLPNVADAQL